MNLAKFRKAQQQLEEAEERTKNAESQKTRLGAERAGINLMVIFEIPAMTLSFFVTTNWMKNILLTYLNHFLPFLPGHREHKSTLKSSLLFVIIML